MTSEHQIKGRHKDLRENKVRGKKPRADKHVFHYRNWRYKVEANKVGSKFPILLLKFGSFLLSNAPLLSPTLELS